MTIKNNLKYKKRKIYFRAFSFIKISSISALDHQQSNMVSGDDVRRRTRPLAIYECSHYIPGEILSNFYLRQSSESPLLMILEAL